MPVDVDEGGEWVFDYVLEVFQSPQWNTPIVLFVDAHCGIFGVPPSAASSANAASAAADEGGENRLSFTTVHRQFAEMVESMLTKRLEEVGLSPEEFVAVLENAVERTDKPEQRATAKGVLEQLLAVEDYQTFKKMMAKRKLEVERETLRAIAGKGDGGDASNGRAGVTAAHLSNALAALQMTAAAPSSGNANSARGTTSAGTADDGRPPARGAVGPTAPGAFDHAGAAIAEGTDDVSRAIRESLLEAEAARRLMEYERKMLELAIAESLQITAQEASLLLDDDAFWGSLNDTSSFPFASSSSSSASGNARPASSSSYAARRAEEEEEDEELRRALAASAAEAKAAEEEAAARRRMAGHGLGESKHVDDDDADDNPSLSDLPVKVSAGSALGIDGLTASMLPGSGSGSGSGKGNRRAVETPGHPSSSSSSSSSSSASSTSSGVGASGVAARAALSSPGLDDDLETELLSSSSSGTGAAGAGRGGLRVSSAGEPGAVIDGVAGRAAVSPGPVRGLGTGPGTGAGLAALSPPTAVPLQVQLPTSPPPQSSSSSSAAAVLAPAVTNAASAAPAVDFRERPAPLEIAPSTPNPASSSALASLSSSSISSPSISSPKPPAVNHLMGLPTLESVRRGLPQIGSMKRLPSNMRMGMGMQEMDSLQLRATATSGGGAIEEDGEDGGMGGGAAIAAAARRALLLESPSADDAPGGAGSGAGAGAGAAFDDAAADIRARAAHWKKQRELLLARRAQQPPAGSAAASGAGSGSGTGDDKLKQQAKAAAQAIMRAKGQL